MTMQLKQKEVVLGKKGKKITIREAGWDYAFRFTEIEKELASKLADPNNNETFKFFCSNYYPLMASCVMGEVPTPEEAFALPSLYLNNWYLTMWELNEDIIGRPLVSAMESEEVMFRDGSSVTVWQSNGLPSFVLKLIELEAYALANPIENDPQGQMFLSVFYPKMAAACNGSVLPDRMEVRNWPRGEISRWMDASRHLNPDWFTVTEEEKVTVEKGKRKKARRRSGG